MLRAELIKALTTRGVVGLILGGAMTVALVAALTILSQRPDQVQRSLAEQQFYLISAIVVAAFTVILGARSFTDEFRHGTIVPTYTLVPRRGRLLASKMLVSGLLGALLALVAIGVIVAVMNLLGGVRDAIPAVDDRALSGILGFVLAGALWAALGAAVGGAVRNQVAAVVGVIVWIVLLENIATGFLGGIAAYLPGRAGYGMAEAQAGGDLVSPAGGGVVLVLYIAAVAVTASALLRRDIGSG